MPLFKNKTTSTLIVTDTTGKKQSVAPNGTVSTYENLSTANWTKLSDLPAKPSLLSSAVKVPVVVAAATFTTVTYADNGGKVQLSSAGVHGLTTSPAVGSKIWVTWAGGTGVSGLQTILSVDSTKLITIDRVYAAGLGTPTPAVAGAEITVASIAVPAMSTVGKIVADASFSMTGSTNSKKALIYWGGAAVVTVDNVTAENVNVRLPQVRIANRGVTNAQVCDILGNGVSGTSGISAKTVDTSVATTLSIRVQAATANEVICLEAYNVVLS